jgi:hypothetical protein
MIYRLERLSTVNHFAHRSGRTAVHHRRWVRSIPTGRATAGPYSDEVAITAYGKLRRPQTFTNKDDIFLGPKTVVLLYRWYHPAVRTSSRTFACTGIPACPCSNLIGGHGRGRLHET